MVQGEQRAAAKNALTGNEARLQEIKRLALRVSTYRDKCKSTHDMLFQRAAGRTKWQKRLYIAAGVFALFSGSAMTSVLLSLTSSLVMKIIAAALAFLSGIISLIMTTFDPRETEKMFDAAASYEKLRNEAESLYDSLYDSRGSTSPGRFRELVDKLVFEWNRLTHDYERLLPDLTHESQSIEP